MRAVCSLLLLTACLERHAPLVICHNANCVGPDVTRDDTVDAMEESLALGVLDGMEWDTFWYGQESRCLFAHDLVNDTSTPASAAADVMGDYLATHPAPFTILIELKPHVGPDLDDAHTPEQLVAHSECALDSAERVLRDAQSPVTLGFVSAAPRMLEVLRARPRWDVLASRPAVELMLVGDIFAPVSSVVPELADYEHIDAVEYHPDFMTRQHREAYRSLGIDLVQWSLVTTTEALAGIEQWEPRFAVTNEAELLRRWIAY